MRGASAGRLALYTLLGVAAIFQSARVAAAEPLLFDVAGAQFDRDPSTNEPTVDFWLTRESTLKFIEQMKKAVGPIEMRVDARVLAQPHVVAFPNVVVISAHFGEQEARDLVARVSSGNELKIEAVAN